MADPLSLKAVAMLLGATPRAGAWLVRTVEDRRALTRMISSALARAVCADDPDDPRVQKVVDAVQSTLPQVEIPGSRRSSRGVRAAQVVFAPVLRRLWRLPKEIPADGPDFFETLAEWIGRAFREPWPREELKTVVCAGSTPDAQAVVDDFPEQMHELVHGEEASTRFGARVRKVLAQHQRDFAAVRAVRRDNRLRQALAELVAGASAYGVLDATVLSTPKAALCGALAALGVHGLAGIQRKHRLGGPRFRAVRIVTELLEARERQPNVIAPKGAHIDAIGSLRGDALAMGDAAFFDALGTAEDCLRYLQLRPDDQRARAAADEALESLLRVARKGGRAWRDESIDD